MRKLLAVALMGLIPALSASLAQDRTFGGYDCTDDCSGHKAGYDWAERNGIEDPSDCSGNSASFAEGCKSYTKDPNRGSDTDDDGGDIE